MIKNKTGSFKTGKGCTNTACKNGIFQVTRVLGAEIVTCVGCTNKGENFGHPMEMPENFVIPPGQSIWDIENKLCHQR